MKDLCLTASREKLTGAQARKCDCARSFSRGGHVTYPFCKEISKKTWFKNWPTDYADPRSLNDISPFFSGSISY